MENKVLLLIEDNLDDVELTQRAFKKNNLCNEIVVVSDGAEAIDYLFAKGKYSNRDAALLPQLVLLDLKLPKVDGIEVLRRIRSDERTKLLPVIVFTTSKEESDLIQSYKNGANSYIRKPVDYDKFMDVVRELGLYWLLLNEAPPSCRR